MWFYPLNWWTFGSSCLLLALSLSLYLMHFCIKLLRQKQDTSGSMHSTLLDSVRAYGSSFFSLSLSLSHLLTHSLTFSFYLFSILFPHLTHYFAFSRFFIHSTATRVLVCPVGTRRSGNPISDTSSNEWTSKTTTRTLRSGFVQSL